jgi:hypothetical protein
MKKILYVLVFTFFANNIVFGQQCGTTIQSIDEMDLYMPGYKIGAQKALGNADKYIQKILLNPNIAQRQGNDTIIIPIVVHVIYNNSIQNVSDANIIKQIEVLNKDFARLNSDTTKTPSSFRNLAKGLPIKFCLAQRDPQGNSTTGINRVQTTKLVWEYENPSTSNDFKFSNKGGLSAWDRDNYLNIWIVNLDDNYNNGRLLGFAQFPGGPSSTDGVALDYNEVGALGRTATHEVGHWLGLIHIWGDKDDCIQDDGIDDTPKQAGNSQNGCRTHPYNDGCSSAIMFMNYMDYSSDVCMNMFSKGQCDRMLGVLNTSRKGLKSSIGCLPANLPAVDANLIELIEPGERICSNVNSNAVVRNFGSQTISTIRFKIKIGSIEQLFDWSGSISSLGKADIDLPSIDISSLTDGFYDYTLEIQLVNGITDSEILNNIRLVSVEKKVASTTTPFFEGFESAFNGSIRINNPDKSKTWERTSKARKTPGSYSIYMNYFDYTNNEEIDEFLLPPVNTSNLINSSITFDVAYALYSTTGFSDTLEVYVQAGCDAPWQRVYKKFNPNLQTAPNTSFEFKPSQTQWRRDSILLDTYKSDNLTVKFVGKCDNENNLYIDNISIKGATSTGINLDLLNTSDFQIFPNPTKGNYFVYFNADKSQEVLISVRDVTGKLLMEKSVSVNMGNNNIEMPSKQLPTGNIFITLTNGTQTGTRKLMVF